MAKKVKQVAVTPVGTFARVSGSRYQHVNVWASPRAREAFEGAATREWKATGVTQRWIKDGGFGVTWHANGGTARKAAAGKYLWDSNSKLVGTFLVVDA